MAKPLTTDRIRMFYSHATGWSMPGAWRNKPKREERLAAVRAQMEAEFDAWLIEHDREKWNEGFSDAEERHAIPSDQRLDYDDRTDWLNERTSAVAGASDG